MARHEHADSDCAYCPICAGIGLLRGARPEVVDHLAGAARELIAALKVVLDEAEAMLSVVEDAARDAAPPPDTAVAPEGPRLRRVEPFG